MNSLVGACHEICDKFAGRVWVLAEPGLPFSCPLCGYGDSRLGCEIPCGMTSHPVRHNPDAAVVQESQRILIRRSNVAPLGSTDTGPLLGLYHGATSTGIW